MIANSSYKCTVIVDTNVADSVKPPQLQMSLAGSNKIDKP